MGTMTAHVLIGDSHPNDGGIRPHWAVQLSENSRPHLVLHNNVNYLAKPVKAPLYFEWTPSIENGVEDILTMIALHAIDDYPLKEKMTSLYPEIFKQRVHVYEIPGDIRSELYQEIRNVTNWPKLVVSLYRGCYLENKIALLEELDIDFEICLSVRAREKSNWGHLNIRREVGSVTRI